MSFALWGSCGALGWAVPTAPCPAEPLPAGRAAASGYPCVCLWESVWKGLSVPTGGSGGNATDSVTSPRAEGQPPQHRLRTRLRSRARARAGCRSAVWPGKGAVLTPLSSSMSLKCVIRSSRGGEIRAAEPSSPPCRASAPPAAWHSSVLCGQNTHSRSAVLAGEGVSSF